MAQRSKFVQVMAWFVVIFGVNTASDISKLLYIIWDNLEISLVVFYAKNHEQIMLLFVKFILLPAKGL